MAGFAPIPKRGIMNASRAIEGIVCSNPAMYITGRENARTRYTRMPKGMATIIPATSAMNVSLRWVTVR